MTRIYSLSLGCPKNRVDSEHALGFLSGCTSLTPVQSPKEADLVFINTCGFIAPAVEESVRAVVETIDELSRLPAKRRPLLVMAGCLVGRYGKQALAPDLPEVDLFLDNRELGEWGRLLQKALEQRMSPQVPQAEEGAACKTPERDPLPYMYGRRLLSTGPSYAWLKISDGCRHACSFCAIPGIRGPLRSMAAEHIEEEARMLLDSGVRELILAAQDLTAWGQDMGLRHGLVSLLEKLFPLPGLDRLRLMYLYPAGLTRELLAFLKAAGPPFMPYFDVPVQHAAQAVLSRMGRPFAGRPHEAVERIRAFFPDAALRTSIIAGFPGESEKDFEELLAFVRESRFMHLGVFAYEAEEGTAAASMPGQIPAAVKRERREAVMEAQAEISQELLSVYVGQRMQVLVDAPQGDWPGLHVGRTWFQAPEIDGLTYISGPGVEPGALVEAEIVESSQYDLTALADAEEA